ncbi:uncharacterized protein BP01DRAFT_359646 [Aspergillus saccharolyticus JOP 1030-1]|uniref:CCHC-type domain-containing protein n=1 Tax=Aspergillus saccharolyticus JOP 1030-1 TaxID=1450539 RepID=A0A318ZF20_9EURO|nr:hypothetical protein BP01DRAFT_359646 [Aspergillus saccharolyticus JOP 1030-1]PYH42200.1 hypothetical protein BP01DRAFT_359646 [Aspergillus saccharolyticus JOP 1030-1]
MLLSRRACYKCGNIGHYAEVCSSTERLCYNCKQPGRPYTMHVIYAPTTYLTRSQDMSPTTVRVPVLLRPSNATTARE